MAYIPLSGALTAALRRELEDAFHDAEEHALRASEPAVVRALGQEIASRCSGLSHGQTSVSASTGFIHQASYVAFAMGPRTVIREAGDLLVIATRRTALHSSVRAALLQAKLFRTVAVPASVGAGDAQHYLYHHWPLISYTFGRSPGTTTRLLGRDRRFQGSRYLMIPKSRRAQDRSSICVTEDNGHLGNPEPAPDYLLNLLRDHAGVPYAPRGPGDWNGFVDDLRHRVQRRSSATPRDTRNFGVLANEPAAEGGLVVLNLLVRDDDAQTD